MRPRGLRDGLRRRGKAQPPDSELFSLTEEDRRYLSSLYDDSVALPAGAELDLSDDHPRLQELRATYAQLKLPVCERSRWVQDAVGAFVDLRHFRGETLYLWHYRELPRITLLKYFVLMGYIRERDPDGLLERLGEDGAFGCWTFDYPGHGRISRDLLESVNEICFLERQLKLSERPAFSVLDIGAGYGRLAHRMAEAYPNLSDYCCVDAIPESTFLSEYYLRHRGLADRARVVSLDRVQADLVPGQFDLAVNVHSFSECTLEAVRWWVNELARLRVPRLLVIPNEPTELLTLETDGTRQDFSALLEGVGYELVKREPVIVDPAVAELVRISDRFYLYELASPHPAQTLTAIRPV